MARNNNPDVRTEYINVTDAEVMGVIRGISEAVDHMVHDFGFAMSVMADISRLLNQSPPNLEMVRIMLDQFFNVYVPDPDNSEDSVSD